MADWDPADHPRDPRNGQFVDKLGLAGRIRLPAGHQLRSSTTVKARSDANYSNAAVLATVDTPDGPELRLGVVDAGHTRNDTRRWAAANRGGTVQLDRGQTERLHRELDNALKAGAAHKRLYDAGSIHYGPDADYEPDETFHRTHVSSPWGDLQIDVTGVDDEKGGYGISLSVKPPDAPPDWDPPEDRVLDLSPAGARKLMKELGTGWVQELSGRMAR